MSVNRTNNESNNVERRISVDGNGNKVQPNTGNSSNSAMTTTSAFAEIAKLNDKLKNNDKLKGYVGDLCNMILTVQTSGVYRNGDTLLISMPQGLVISTPDYEYSLDVNTPLVAGVMVLCMAGADSEILAKVGETIDLLHLSHEDITVNAF